MVRPPAHSFPHRGSPSTSHTRVRWQPYHQATQPRSSPLAYLVTPASSASPSPSSLSEPDRPRHVLYPPRDSKLREIQKSKFALSLVGEYFPLIHIRLLSPSQDQAVKSLCDIWPQQNIPTVFLTSGRPVVPLISGSEQQVPNVPHSAFRITHLPSPISPTTQPTPVVSPVQSYPTHSVACPQPHRGDIAPMKCFVHEVLRRSRTSGTVLQTALCYLEAIRSKIPDLIRKEKQAFSSSSRAESDDDRISKGEVGIDYDTDLDSPSPSIESLSSSSPLATVRINPVSCEADSSLPMEPALDAAEVPTHKINSAYLSPLPPLPSPLLCPRRAFLASLILASKFMQDRCYSNRAWAKLSGLPPREIGRCERALGEALEWRLWVGKLPAAQSTSGRPLTKCKSESDIDLSDNPRMVHTVLPTFGNALSPTGSKIRRRATAPPGNLFMDGPRMDGFDDVSPTSYSASPSTPGLSYSPTPTESSLGDRTVQMATFMDVPTPPPTQFASFTGAQNDKVLATLSVPLNGPFLHASSQEMALSSFPQRIDSPYWVSHGVVPSTVWMFHDDA